MMNEDPGITTIVGYPENLATLLRQNGVDIPDFRGRFLPEVRRRIWFRAFQRVSNEYHLLKETCKSEQQAHSVLSKKLMDDWGQKLPEFTAPAITPTSWHSLHKVRKAINAARTQIRSNPVRKQYHQLRAGVINTWLKDIESFADVLGAKFIILKSKGFEPFEDDKKKFWASFNKGGLPFIRSYDGHHEWRALKVGDTAAFQNALVTGKLNCPLTRKNTEVKYQK